MDGRTKHSLTSVTNPTLGIGFIGEREANDVVNTIDSANNTGSRGGAGAIDNLVVDPSASIDSHRESIQINLNNFYV